MPGRLASPVEGPTCCDNIASLLDGRLWLFEDVSPSPRLVYGCDSLSFTETSSQVWEAETSAFNNCFPSFPTLSVKITCLDTLALDKNNCNDVILVELQGGLVLPTTCCCQFAAETFCFFGQIRPEDIPALQGELDPSCYLDPQNVNFGLYIWDPSAYQNTGNSCCQPSDCPPVDECGGDDPCNNLAGCPAWFECSFRAAAPVDATLQDQEAWFECQAVANRLVKDEAFCEAWFECKFEAVAVKLQEYPPEEAWFECEATVSCIIHTDVDCEAWFECEAEANKLLNVSVECPAWFECTFVIESGIPASYECPAWLECVAEVQCSLSTDVDCEAWFECQAAAEQTAYKLVECPAWFECVVNEYQVSFKDIDCEAWFECAVEPELKVFEDQFCPAIFNCIFEGDETGKETAILFEFAIFECSAEAQCILFVDLPDCEAWFECEAVATQTAYKSVECPAWFECIATAAESIYRLREETAWFECQAVAEQTAYKTREETAWFECEAEAQQSTKQSRSETAYFECIAEYDLRVPAIYSDTAWFECIVDVVIGVRGSVDEFAIFECTTQVEQTAYKPYPEFAILECEAEAQQSAAKGYSDTAWFECISEPELKIGGDAFCSGLFRDIWSADETAIREGLLFQVAIFECVAVAVVTHNVDQECTAYLECTFEGDVKLKREGSVDEEAFFECEAEALKTAIERWSEFAIFECESDTQQTAYKDYSDTVYLECVADATQAATKTYEDTAFFECVAQSDIGVNYSDQAFFNCIFIGDEKTKQEAILFERAFFECNWSADAIRPSCICAFCAESTLQFAGDTWIDLPTSYDTSADLKFRFKLTVDDVDASAFIINAGNNGGGLVFRAREIGQTPRWRMQYGFQGANNSLPIVSGQEHDIEILFSSTGNHWVSVDGGAQVNFTTSVPTAGSQSNILFGGRTNDTDRLVGQIAEIQRLNPITDDLTNEWPINEGGGTVINDIIGTQDGTLTLGAGAWTAGGGTPTITTGRVDVVPFVSPFGCCLAFTTDNIYDLFIEDCSPSTCSWTESGTCLDIGGISRFWTIEVVLTNNTIRASLIVQEEVSSGIPAWEMRWREVNNPPTPLDCTAEHTLSAQVGYPRCSPSDNACDDPDNPLKDEWPQNNPCDEIDWPNTTFTWNPLLGIIEEALFECNFTAIDSRPPITADYIEEAIFTAD